jgi:copper transport protein
MIRRAAYLLAALFLAALAVLGTSTAALAHARLESTSPPDGSTVAKAPVTVSATFDESVGVSADSLRVYAPNGDRADDGNTTHTNLPQQITVGLLPGLGRGTYTVAWHVISADSHPVQGAFTFSVGAPSSSVVTPASLQPPASHLVSFTFGVVRWLAYCFFALLIGAVAFVICCWPAGATRPGVQRLTMGAWGGLAAATLAAILLQGVYGASQSLSHVFWPDVLHATLGSTYGRALGIRLLLVVAALIALSITLESLSTGGRRTRYMAAAIWAALTIGLASTWAVADHAGTGIQVPLAVPSDVIHLTAIAIWIGGLVMLVTLVLRRPDSPADPRKAERRRYQAATAEAARAVSRFSPIALGCVVAIVVTGTYQAWRGVGTWGALFGTTYGHLLLVKIAAMCALVGLGNLARQRVARLRAPVAAIAAAHASPVREAAPAELVTVKAGGRGRGGNGPRARRGGGRNGTAGPDDEAPLDEAQENADQAGVTLTRLRWSVSVEVAIVMVVLAVTAVLVNSPTARETYAPPASASTAFNTGGPQGTGTVSVLVTPARLGPNQIRVTVTNASGQPYRPQQIQAALALPARNLGPLSVTLTAQGPGTYLSTSAVVTIIGQWQLQITIRSDAFDETTVTLPISVH